MDLFVGFSKDSKRNLGLKSNEEVEQAMGNRRRYIIIKELPDYKLWSGKCFYSHDISDEQKVLCDEGMMEIIDICSSFRRSFAPARGGQRGGGPSCGSKNFSPGAPLA